MRLTLPSFIGGAAVLCAAGLAATLAAKDTNSSSPSQASMPTPVAPDPATQVKHQDREFLEAAAKAGMREVMVSQTTVSRLSSPQVRDLANTMINDHTAADRSIRTLALSKGVVLEDWDAKANAKLAEKWSDKGGDLGQKYLRAMVEDHEDAVKLFTKESEKGDDAEIVAFARSMLPTLQHHLDMARSLGTTR